MNKKKIILLSSGGVALVFSLVFGGVTIGQSYNDWKSDYDAVMEINKKAKYTTIEGVTISDVFLEKDDFKPYYSIAGYYDETVNPDTINLKLNTLDDRYNYAEIVKKDIDEEARTFKLSADISYVSCDGDGNEMYNHNEVNSVTLLDSIDRHALYPKLVVGEQEEFITNFNKIWKGGTLDFKNCKYEIKMNATTSEFPFAMPALIKTTTQEIPYSAHYEATGVQFEKFGDDIFYILNGTSSGYNRDTLSKVITFEMRSVMPNNNVVFAIRGTQGGPLVMDENGNFKLFVRVNDIPTTNLDCPYFTRFGQQTDAKNNICDLKVPGVNGTSDCKSFTANGKRYTILINHGSYKADAYGTTGLKVETL